MQDLHAVSKALLARETLNLVEIQEIIKETAATAAAAAASSDAGGGGSSSGAAPARESDAAEEQAPLAGLGREVGKEASESGKGQEVEKTVGELDAAEVGQGGASGKQ